MDRFESLDLNMGFGLMVVFFVALVGLICFTDFPPFKEGKEYEVHLLSNI